MAFCDLTESWAVLLEMAQITKPRLGEVLARRFVNAASF